LLCVWNFFSQTPPPGQTTGGVLRQEEQIEKIKKLEKKIKEKRPKPEEIVPEEIAPEEVGKKVFIKKIIVEGVTLIPEEDIKKITSQFEGRELSLKDMQKVADLITDEYRKRGYVTSRAYIPPQTIRNSTLIIRVVEGKVGKLEIKGNRYFKTELLRKKINFDSGGYFDYSALQKSLVYINEHPDRFAKAVLVPGKTPGTTDIIIEVKDRLPIHAGFEFDNFGSRFIDKERGSFVFEHNNFLGFDDKLYFRLQRSEANLFQVKQLRYSFPVNPTLEVGMYVSHSKMKLGEEFKDVDARGKATIASIFLNKALISTEKLDLRFNFAFDYKRIRNYLLGIESSRDDVRVVRTGFDIDFNDKWGRNIVTLEVDSGIPRMFGALTAKDPKASRSGAGGKFIKVLANYFRLQPSIFSSNILWKNFFQFSPYTLVASEQFQIGGPVSVRGYPPAEYSGDKGLYSSFEWSFPPYFISKKMKVPFTKNTTFYDALRIVLFYDWATSHVNKVLVGEKKHHTLKGYGFGVRFIPNDNFSLRVEVGYPQGSTPSDTDHAHPWVEFKWKF